jgi:hypothetical protein
MDQSLSVGLSAIARGDDATFSTHEHPWEYADYELGQRELEDSVNCNQERAVVIGI